jgi:hypothetical protein
MHPTKCHIIIVVVVLIVEQVIHVVNHYLRKQQEYHVIGLFQFQNIYPVH